jgi:outer membrane cobalamin receptor
MSKLLLACLVLMLNAFCVDAQAIISGKVIDAISRQPLESATVSITGSNYKTLTDHYGNFSIQFVADKPGLTVSYIGYKSSVIPVDKNRMVKVELQPDQLNLKDVVVLAGNSNAVFSNLAKTDLELKPVKNTQELLRIVPGLFIAQHVGGGKAEQIFLRGFDCDHGTDVAVSVDGLPVNMVSHAHGQGYADAHFIIPETINNIDFGAGPYYTQHGDLNTAGYVNFSTYNNIDKSRVQAEAGQFNTFRTLAMIDLLKKNKEKQSAYIAGEFYYTDGPSDHPQSFNKFNVFGKYNVALSSHTQLTSSASFFKSKWDASGQVPERAVQKGTIGRFGSIDPSEGGNTERENLNILIAHRFNNGRVWENQVYYTHYVFNLYSDFTFFLNDPINGDEINQAESRNMVGYLSKYTQNNFFKGWSLRSVAGVGIRYDATDSSKLAHVVKRQFLNYINLDKIKQDNSFAYLQEQASIGKWLIEAGVRFDYLHFNYLDELNPQLPSQRKSIISPKLNIQYTVNNAVQLYAKAGKGFHSNDARVVIPNNGYKVLPAAYGADLGIILKPVNHLFLNIAAWYLYLDQEFVYSGDDAVIIPSGKTRREGIDLIARYQFNSKLFANLNLNVTRPRAIGEAKGQDYIPLAPIATSTGGIFYKSRQGFNGSISYRYMKSRPANEDNSIVAKGYFVTDAVGNYTKKNYEIGLSIENLFNTEWNEAQFATESRLKDEPASITELNFTPGTPFFARIRFTVFF